MILSALASLRLLFSFHLYTVREENQLKIICRIIEQYRLNEPFSRYLKSFFKAHPQMGSNDRRLASSFSYNYFRLGKALNDLRLIERLTIANFLCSGISNTLLAYCLKKFSLLKEEDVTCPLAEKIIKIKEQHPAFNIENIFPFADHLSESINKKHFTTSFLIQPKLWIRIRRGFEEKVNEELISKNILFGADEKNPNILSFLNATSLEKTDSFLNGYFEIQDWSSQKTLDFIQPKPNETWWDACAGSGGKSLMMADAEPTLNIFASDTRNTILNNLEERFKKAGVKNYKTAPLNLTEADLQSSISNHPFLSEYMLGGILADVPCSGSGTWARTPEWLTMFNENSLGHFVTLQRNIITNLSSSLRPGQPLVYITCSVFKEENELNVKWMEENLNLFLQKSAYIEGFFNQADTLFVACFILRNND